MQNKHTYDIKENEYRYIQLQDDISKATYKNLLARAERLNSSAITGSSRTSSNITPEQELTLQEKLREAV